MMTLLRSRTRCPFWAMLTVASLVLLSAPAAAMAQTFTGAISGSVKDSSDSVVPGATVTVTNTKTGQSRTAVSGAEGEFIFPALQPGEYQLDAELSGFSKKSLTGVILTVNQRLEVPIRLEVGQLSDTVSVVAEAVLVNTTDPTVGQVIEEKRVVDLPLNGRDFVQLATLSAGVETRQTTRGLLATNGTRGNSLSFLFDGVDGNDANAIFLSLTPSIEAIQEFKIQTSTYSAEFGRNAGAQINLITSNSTRTCSPSESITRSRQGTPCSADTSGATRKNSTRSAEWPVREARTCRASPPAFRQSGRTWP
jgi:hypothetical protein